MDNLAGILTGAIPAILKAKTLREPECRAGLEALAIWRGRPDASFWYVICVAEGEVP
jgi:hypothetical protein